MAIPHLEMKSHSRSKGQSCCAAAAYASASYIKDAEGKIHDYHGKRQEIVYSKIISFDDRQIDRSQYWRDCEAQNTRKNATFSRSLIISLPKEINQSEQEKLAQEFCNFMIEEYQLDAIDLNIHSLHEKKRAEKDHQIDEILNAEDNNFSAEDNPHMHLMFKNCDRNGNAFKRKKGKKDVYLFNNNPEEISKIRKKWEVICNKYLKKNNTNEHIFMCSIEKEMSIRRRLMLLRVKSIKDLRKQVEYEEKLQQLDQEIQDAARRGNIILQGGHIRVEGEHVNPQYEISSTRGETASVKNATLSGTTKAGSDDLTSRGRKTKPDNFGSRGESKPSGGGLKGFGQMESGSGSETISELIQRINYKLLQLEEQYIQEVINERNAERIKRQERNNQEASFENRATPKPH